MIRVSDAVLPLAAPRASRLSMATVLAWTNLAHDRVRLAIAVVGVAFAVLLMAVQLSLLFGFAQTAAGLVSHSGADLWIAGRGTKDVDQAVDIPARRRYEALAVPGVRSADKYIVHFSLFRRPDGGTEYILLVGYTVDHGVGAPWNLVEGSLEDLKRPDAIIIDDLYKEKLGVTHLGQVVEINNHRARVVGITHGIRTFVQSPYIFASFETAQHLGDIAKDATKYVLVTLEPGADPAQVKSALRDRMSTVDVFDNDEFAFNTQSYWLLSTGAGVDLILAALLGVVIGVVITAQTLYASAADHLPEYATLRAMGAADGFLRGIIMRQAFMNAVLGYAVGISIALLIVYLAGDGVAALVLPWQLILTLGVVTVAMCTLSGVVAIRRVLTANPTSIFR